MNTVTLLQNDFSDDSSSDCILEVSKQRDNEDNDDARSITGSVAGAVHYLESKELRHLIKERKKMIFEIERCHPLIDSLELKNKLLTEDHEYVKKKYALCLMERKQRVMKSLIEDLKLKIIPLLDYFMTNGAKTQLSEINIELAPNQGQNQRLTTHLDTISSGLKTDKKLSKILRELIKAQRVEADGSDYMNVQLEKMLQISTGRETVEFVVNCQKDSIEQIESTFKAANASLQKLVDTGDYQLHKTENYFSIAKQLADSQMIGDGKQLDELAEMIKVVSDWNITDSKSHLAEKESLIVKEQAMEPFDHIPDQKHSFDLMRNSVVNHYAELDKKLAATKTVLDSQVLESRNRLITDGGIQLNELAAASKIQEKWAILQRSVHKMVGEGVFSRQEELMLIEEQLINSEVDLQEITESTEKDAESKSNLTIQMLQDKEKISNKKLFDLENELREIKEFSKLEHNRHEEQIVSLLKMAGLYDLDLDPTDKSPSYWVQPNHELLEAQRSKILALKSCLVRFTDRLNSADKKRLMTVGIIL